MAQRACGACRSSTAAQRFHACDKRKSAFHSLHRHSIGCDRVRKSTQSCCFVRQTRITAAAAFRHFPGKILFGCFIPDRGDERSHGRGRYPARHHPLRQHPVNQAEYGRSGIQRRICTVTGNGEVSFSPGAAWRTSQGRVRFHGSLSGCRSSQNTRAHSPYKKNSADTGRSPRHFPPENKPRQYGPNDRAQKARRTCTGLTRT